MKLAPRLQGLPPNIFAVVNDKKLAAAARGVDVIDLGQGSPDLAPPPQVVEALCRAARNPGAHRYSLNRGRPELRKAIASYYRRRFGVELDPDRQVLPLVGSKEGIVHLLLAIIGDREQVLCPNPAYPAYAMGTKLADGTIVDVPLLAENNYLPDYDAIPKETLRTAKALFLNYPNNPTAAVATLSDFEHAFRVATEYDLMLCADLAYCELTFDGYLAPSLMQVPGAPQRALEFNSCSKTFSMAGWRIGFAVGAPELIDALALVKQQLDYQSWFAIQEAAIEALTQVPDEWIRENAGVYQARRDALVGGMRAMGWPVEPPKGSMYVWAPVPAGRKSIEFADELLAKSGVVVVPGIGFGVHGEGFVRFALVQPEERLREATERLGEMKLDWSAVAA